MHATFQAAILEDPSDDLNWQAYADWLAERGDPRGALMHLQLSLAHTRTAAERAPLLAQQAELVENHAEAILGPLAQLERTEPHLACVPQFYRGWLAELSLYESIDTVEPLLDSAAFVPFLQRLNLWYESNVRVFSHSIYAQLFDVPRDFVLPSLRDLQIGALQHPPCGGGGFAALLAERAPRLSSLSAYGELVHLPALLALALPELENLSIQTEGPVPWHVLADNPKLTELKNIQFLSIQNPSDEAADAVGLEAFARSPHFPSLRFLSLIDQQIDDRCCAALARSGLLQRLKYLDLQNNQITNAGVEALRSIGYPLLMVNLAGNPCDVAGD